MLRNSLKGLIAINTLVVLFCSISCNQKNTKEKSPNIICIMVDDMGYSDPGCYGGEINTPNIDYLANNGLRFTDFHNAARCSPSRASLLTGVYPHEANMADIGHSLSKNVVTVAEVLKEKGYQTGMSGKWHLSLTEGLNNQEKTMQWVGHLIDAGDFSPLETYPVNRGFNEHYGVIWGVVNHYDPFSLVHNEKPIKNVPKGFYLTEFITDKSVELTEKFSKKGDPFFLYVAYSAPHWPLHAKKEDIKKYEHKYDEGWDVLRKRRYEKSVALGLFDPQNAPYADRNYNKGTTVLSDSETNSLDWDTYTDQHKRWEARHMETHAAMVDRVDQGIGKLINKLKELGQLDNTIILFLSDNGASPERVGKKPGHHRTKYMRNGKEIKWILSEQDTIAPGAEDTYGFLGPGWAGALNAPFRYWKAESYEGGTATPFIVYWPEGLKTKKGAITNQFGTVMDIMPTILDITGTSYPDNFQGNKIIPHSGHSLLPIFKGEKSIEHRGVYWEHRDGKASREGNWKISALKNQKWQLFNLKNDRTETQDLAAKYPEKVADLERKWKQWFDSMPKSQ